MPTSTLGFRLRTSSRHIVVFLDESLAGFGQLQSPVDHLTLAFELSQGPVMQIKQLRIIPSGPP